MKKAFVIQAVGAMDSDTRKRADRVLKEIIQKACDKAGYKAERADEMVTRTIVEPIISALNTYPLVIADLGGPPWNSNVLMEVGFRLATGRPIVFVADANPVPDLLPLHLRNVRIHLINSSATSEADIETLRASIERYGPEVNYWASDYPTIEFSISRAGEEGGRFIFANDQAARLYGLEHANDLIGKPLSEIDSKLQEFIPMEHYKEYEQDQLAILGKIWTRMAGPKMAEVPLWFVKHTYDDEKHQIYWPVLVQYRYFSDDDNTDAVMRVIFINVNEWDAVFPGRRFPPQVLKVPHLFRKDPGQFDQEIFVSYNSQDGEFVRTFCDILRTFNFKVWLDESDLIGDHALSSELIREISRSRILAVVLGPSGLGRWQEDVELRTFLLRVIRNGMPCVLFLLPELGVDDDWKQLLPDDMRPIFEDKIFVRLPSRDELGQMVAPGPQRFIGRLIKFLVQVIRTPSGN